MSEPVLEIVEFRTSGDSDALYDAARKMESWLRAQPGFRWRRLAVLEDGAFLDSIEWADIASAKAAAEQIMDASPTVEFMPQRPSGRTRSLCSSSLARLARSGLEHRSLSTRRSDNAELSCCVRRGLVMSVGFIRRIAEGVLITVFSAALGAAVWTGGVHSHVLAGELGPERNGRALS